MKQKLFEIGHNKITMFPYEIWKIAGFAFAILFPVCWLAFLLWVGMFQLQPIVIFALVNLTMLLPFFYIGNKQIILDGNTLAVLQKSWLGIKKVGAFSDIEDVMFVDVLVYNSRTNGYYKLTFKKKPYGKGIQLTMGLSKTTKQFKLLETVAIPFIKTLLATATKLPEAYKLSRIETEAAGFKMFHQHDNRFLSKPFKTTNLVMAILLFGIGLFVLYHFITNLKSEKEYYWLLLLVAAIANAGIWGRRVLLNPLDHLIETSYLGLFKKTYHYRHIIGFSTLRHIDGLYNPTDIRIEIKNGTSIQQITLFSRISNKKKLQLLMEETKRILA